MGPFIKDVINQGGGGFAKRWPYLINLFSKNDDEGGQKSQKIDDVFYERPLISIGSTTGFFNYVIVENLGIAKWFDSSTRSTPNALRKFFDFDFLGVRFHFIRKSNES